MNAHGHDQLAPDKVRLVNYWVGITGHSGIGSFQISVCFVGVDKRIMTKESLIAIKACRYCWSLARICNVNYLVLAPKQNVKFLLPFLFQIGKGWSFTDRGTAIENVVTNYSGTETIERSMLIELNLSYHFREIGTTLTHDSAME